MIGVILILSICAFLLLKFVLFVASHRKRRNEFAHFPQLPTNFLGETSFFRKHPVNHHIMQRLNEIASHFVHEDKLFLSWMLVIPTVFIFNKDYVKQILSKNEPEMLNKGVWLYKGINDIVPNSLLTVNGDKWKIRRKILSPPFHTTNLDNFVKITNCETARLVAHLRKAPCKDTLHEMKKLTLSIFCKLLFEYDIDDEVEATVQLANKTTDILVRKAFSVFLVSPALYRFTGLASEESQMLKELMIFKNKMLNAKSESLAKNLKSKLDRNQNELDGKSNNLSLIELLLKNFKKSITGESNWPGFEMDEIRAQLDTFIIAGLDTLSIGLTFLLYHFAKYADYQEQIYKEITQVFGDDRQREATLEEVKKFVLLDAFISESMRIRPVVPLISRSLDTDITFPSTKQTGGYTLPAGTDIVFYLEKVLNDPDYFEQPHVFRPERWFQDQKNNLYLNIPFSGGPRNCVAKKIALHIMAFAAVDLIRNYEIQFAPSTPREITESMLKYELVTKPINEIELRFVKRQSSSVTNDH